MWGWSLFTLWGVSTAVAAFYIPIFDYGFDGVKLWLVASLFMLAGYGLLVVAVRLAAQSRR